MIAGILTVNNNCDLENDRASGRRTLTILLGLKGGRVLLWTEYAAAIVLQMIMQYKIKIVPKGFFPVTALTAGFIIYRFIRMERHGYSSATKGRSMKGILSIFSAGVIILIFPWMLRLVEILI